MKLGSKCTPSKSWLIVKEKHFEREKNVQLYKNKHCNWWKRHIGPIPCSGLLYRIMSDWKSQCGLKIWSFSMKLHKLIFRQHTNVSPATRNINWTTPWKKSKHFYKIFTRIFTCHYHRSLVVSPFLLVLQFKISNLTTHVISPDNLNRA